MSDHMAQIDHHDRLDESFYGIHGIRFIWHGINRDPEIVWHGRSFNYYALEMSLYEHYREECYEQNIALNDDLFAIWVKKNAHLCREYLRGMLAAEAAPRKLYLTKKTANIQHT